jgi:hypothetical protein
VIDAAKAAGQVLSDPQEEFGWGQGCGSAPGPFGEDLAGMPGGARRTAPRASGGGSSD